MIDRVRPAQLTTTVVSGSRGQIVNSIHHFCIGQADRSGIDMR